MPTSFKSLNPATLEVIWQGEEASHKEVEMAFARAQNAFSDWSSLAIGERIGYLHKYQNLLREQKDHFAEIISMETGKPLWESQNEVISMINKVDISIEAFQIRCPDRSLPQKPYISMTRHKPHGVVAVLGPYNFPGHLPNGHIVPALLAGNTVVFKPSELTPWVGEKLVQCWLDSGLPPGVLNLVQGGASVGKLITSQSLLNGLFFTGSWPTGKRLLEQFSTHPEKILALEMGGNNPLIFHEVKNLEAAAYLTVQSAFISTGQRCTCARRLIVVESERSGKFIDSLLEQMKGIKIGNYTDQPEPFMGPLISEQAAQKLMKSQENLISLGAIPIQTMHLLKTGTGFITPGVIDVTAVKDRPDVEYFGPFLQLIRVPTLEAAMQEANHTAYGLVAGLFSDDADAYQLFYRQVRAGVINWNTPLTGASSTAPFGGIGHSGNFRPSAFYAADYCSYPVASLETDILQMPRKLTPGLILHGHL